MTQIGLLFRRHQLGGGDLGCGHRFWRLAGSSNSRLAGLGFRHAHRFYRLSGSGAAQLTTCDCCFHRSDARAAPRARTLWAGLNHCSIGRPAFGRGGGATLEAYIMSISTTELWFAISGLPLALGSCAFRFWVLSATQSCPNGSNAIFAIR